MIIVIRPNQGRVSCLHASFYVIIRHLLHVVGGSNFMPVEIRKTYEFGSEPQTTFLSIKCHETSPETLWCKRMQPSADSFSVFVSMANGKATNIVRKQKTFAL